MLVVLQRVAQGGGHGRQGRGGIAGAQAGGQGARQWLALRLVEHQKVQAQAFAGLVQLGGEGAAAVGRGHLQGGEQGLRAGHALRARTHLDQHLVEIAARHGQIAAHLGDEQAVVGHVAP
ncbi:hypothetical protein D9M69_678020 [compost metagenome]